MSDFDSVLLSLLQTLAARGYRFVTPTPATHDRVLARRLPGEARSLTDLLGWSMPFADGAIDADVVSLLAAADALAPAKDGLRRSLLRVASCRGRLYLHSAFPTDDPHSVFFGPDSYRFADLIDTELGREPPRDDAVIVDIGTGAGVGAIVAGGRVPGARIAMTDINPAALRLARINAAAAGVVAQPILGSDLAGIDGAIDVALANPPFIMDDANRAYRDGGAMLGGQISLDMATMAAARLAPGGRILLYTGSAIVDGRDALGETLAALAGRAGLSLAYREIDPDVFGEELEKPAYAGVDRIAAVAAVFTKA